MASSSSSQSYNHDVFLSFRGEDTRRTFVDYLYSTLVDRMISTYKDDETLPRGESIRPALFKAIEGSQIAVVIFSENYAESSWCLDELEHIMKCREERKLIVMPIFYCVDPSEVRKQKRKFGEAFAIHEKENISKAETWRKALVDASDIAGWEPKHIANGHEMKAINEIVDTISDTLFSLTSDVDEDLVGMEVRLKQLEDVVNIKSPGVRMVGIWGLGGGGKTTLATSLCMRISCHFQGHCIVENIREESAKRGLKALQENLLLSLLKTQIGLQSVSHGKLIIKSRLSRSNVLIILDDVDHIDQLDALAGSCNWFGSGSRIIITTRDKQLLISHKEVHVFPVMLLLREEAIQLFNKRAYNKNKPVKDYDELSSSVVSYAAGLPLALKVIGSFLCGKNEEEWRCTLARLKDKPDKEIVEILKISYDGLKPSEKQLFLDIACFFRWESTNNVMGIFEACGYDPGIGITVLRQKALITIVDGEFNMHDLVQEMGHYIVKGDQRNNPEKHSRVWEEEYIKYLAGETMENDKIEAVKLEPTYPNWDVGDPSLIYKMVSNLRKLRWVYVNCIDLEKTDAKEDDAEGPIFLSNELRYIVWVRYPRSPFPDCFQPLKLVHLILRFSLQKELWMGYKHLPRLKVLKLYEMKNLLRTPDFDGLPCLQKLILKNCNELTEIPRSLGKHTSLEYISVSRCNKLRMFPTIVQMGKLKTLKIELCHKSLEFPEIKSNMESLVKLSLVDIGIDSLLSSIGKRCANLTSLHLNCCYYMKIGEANFDGLKHLKDFELCKLEYKQMQCRIPLRHWYGSQLSIWLWPLFPKMTLSLQKLDLSNCHLTDGEIPSSIGELSNLRELDLIYNPFTRLHFSLSQLTQLKVLSLSWCKSLVELPELPSRLAILRADGCRKLKAIGDFHKKCKWLCQVYLTYGTIINDGSCRLLEAMLLENANHNMILVLGGFEIAKGFISPLVRGGDKCRLQLQENWRNDFSGFLICCVGSFIKSVSMKGVMSGMESEDEVVWVLWDESQSDEYGPTEFWYISFASLSQQTAWWNSTYTEVLFSIEGRLYDRADKSGFGVGLVPRKSGSGSTQTPTAQEESEFSNYAPKFHIRNDSNNALFIYFLERQFLDYSWTSGVSS